MKTDKTDKRTLINAVKIDLLKIDFKSKYMRLLGSIRELKEKKEELESAFAEIEDIYNHAPCGYHSLDDTGIFVRINDTELKWLGENRAAIIGKKKFTEILTPESRFRFLRIFPLLMKTGLLNNEAFEFVRKDGSHFPVLLNATAVYDEKGNYKMSRCVVTDVSTLKLMEQDFQRSNDDLLLKNETLAIENEQLSLLNHEKQRFMDIASHDLQLPLSAICMLSEALIKKDIPADSQSTRQLYEMIHQASLEMKSLLANYLSANLSETGTLQLLLTEIDLNKLARDIADRYIPAAAKKNIQLQVAESKPVLVLTDRECCTHIIDNLISNAVKYTEQGKNIQVSVKSNAGEAVINVVDQGPGIRKEDRHRLFKRFQKLSARPTGGELSTGLGLSIVKYLAEQLHGNIQVESEPGKGSTFSVYLPFHHQLID